jgi:hypothetical protein
MWEEQGYSKLVDLLLSVSELLHGMGKVVMGDSGLL